MTAPMISILDFPVARNRAAKTLMTGLNVRGSGSGMTIDLFVGASSPRMAETRKCTGSLFLHGEGVSKGVKSCNATLKGKEKA